MALWVSEWEEVCLWALKCRVHFWEKRVQESWYRCWYAEDECWKHFRNSETICIENMQSFFSQAATEIRYFQHLKHKNNHCGNAGTATDYFPESSEHVKAPTHRPAVQLPYPTTLLTLCCLLSDPFGRKVALNTTLRRAAYSTAACTFCTCARCNKRVAFVLWDVNERLMHVTLFTFDQNET